MRESCYVSAFCRASLGGKGVMHFRELDKLIFCDSEAVDANTIATAGAHGSNKRREKYPVVPVWGVSLYLPLALGPNHWRQEVISKVIETLAYT